MNFRGFLAECYDALYADKQYADEAAAIAADLKPALALGNDLLEYGCGTGNFLRQWSRFDWHAVGYDPSPDMVRIARDKGLAADVVPVPRHSVQAVVSPFAVMSYVPQRTIVDTLRRLRSAMTTGGILAFDVFHLACAITSLRTFHEANCTINGQSVRYTISKSFRAVDSTVVANVSLLCPSDDRKWSETHHLTAYDPNGLRRIVEASGFGNVQLLDYEHRHRSISLETCYLYCVAEAV